MTMISSYYAQVGIGVDRASLKHVQSYLNGIEKQLKSFQNRVSRTSVLNVKINIDVARARLQIQRSLNAASRGAEIRIAKVNVSGVAIAKALKQATATNTTRNALRLDARLSQASLAGMKQQVRQSLSNITISPRINPRVGRATGGGTGSSSSSSGGSRNSRDHRSVNPTSGRNMNPYHNPMMLGGAAGAFMRYGAYSLPFVAGAYGLNTLANRAQMYQGQRMALDMTANTTGGGGLTGGQYSTFLNDLGDRLGKTTADMTPFFTHMLAGAKGTELEPHLQSGFASLMEFGSVMNLDGEAMKGTIRAFSQMIGKQQIMAEELRGQAAEHLPPVVRMMAEAVAGGDVKKLNKMMEAGELDPSKHLPLLFEAMRNNAAPFMENYFQSLTYNMGYARKKTEDWLKEFLNSGGTTAISSFFDTWGEVIESSIPNAKSLGKYFEVFTHYFNAAILAPKEFVEWWNDKGRPNNFMTSLFGEAGESVFVQTIKSTFSQVSDAITASMDKSKDSVVRLKDEVSLISSFLTPLIRDIGSALELSAAYDRGGLTGLREKGQELNSRGEARRQAEIEANEIFMATGKRVPLSEIKSREDAIFVEKERARKAQPEDKSWWGMVTGADSEALSQVNDSPLNPENWGKAIADGIKSGLNSWLGDKPTGSSTYTPGTIGQTAPTIPGIENYVPAQTYKVPEMAPIPTAPLGYWPLNTDNGAGGSPPNTPNVVTTTNTRNVTINDKRVYQINATGMGAESVAQEVSRMIKENDAKNWGGLMPQFAVDAF